jgi:hypothetical protein
MTNATANFLGLTDDADPRDRPPSSEEVSRMELLDDLKAVLRQHYFETPRNLQKALGPSEVGHPCARKIAAGLLEFDRINPEGDPLPSWVGTAGHSRFELSVDLDNEKIIDRRAADEADNGEYATERCTFLPHIPGIPAAGEEPIGRWLSERRVTVRPGLAGTADLYDTWTDTVIDLKFPGVTKCRHYRKHGPVPEYRAQGHLYGKGYRNEGFDVKRVAIWFIPRGGFLSDSFVWSEPYNEQLVDDVLTKLDNISVLLDEFQIENHPERLKIIPATPSNCEYCPIFSPPGGVARTAVYGCAGAA